MKAPPIMLKYVFTSSSVAMIARDHVLVKTKIRVHVTFVGLYKKGVVVMVTLYERLCLLCESKGVKGGRMCTDLGISKSLMTDLKSGRKKGVNAETAQKIASYFGVSVGYLLGEEEKQEQPTENDGLSEKRKMLMDFVMSVPEDKAEMLLRVMKSIVEAD
jgi:transcriptional regulator with XRE-family HTH domain